MNVDIISQTLQASKTLDILEGELSSANMQAAVSINFGKL